MIPRISPSNIRGISDKVVGLGKEIFGSALGNDRLKRSGQLQQDAGTERLKALEEQTKAEARGGQAKTAETRERAAQREKANA
ncbi:MAG TPA: CsbD family protein [Mycobacteriales bacterium]|nr:CsbD family protein [Mycobacteriales bacterium]